jgi:hypothetical protein
LTDDRTDEIYDDVQRAARTVARKWPDVIDEDDAEQEIWLRLYGNDYIGTLADAETPSRRSVLNRIGGQVASQYRDDYEAFSGQVTYGTDEVRRMLTSGMLTRTDFDPSSETLTEYIDLHEAAKSLRDSDAAYAEIVWQTFVLKEPPGHTQRVTRAVDALTREMNRVNRRRWSAHHDGPGSRKVISNEASRAATGYQWDGNS